MTSTNTQKNTSAKTRKAAALGLAVLGVAGLSLASAAQLNLGTGSIGAGTTVIASCQPEETPINVAFDSAFSGGSNPGYEATALNLTSIDPACNGHDYKVTLTDADGSVLGQEATGTVSGTSLTVPLTDVPAKDVSNVAVVIHS
ncbi:hypothetical protein [Arthrobacter koreensis]|uniref:hypothetical protein n=1 Tax=Arthrobacter koreensis TaxID=199136 RepID=UPI002DB7597A|nr:hypothetical protein [Arthrobacter koreensis]MEB7503845.1 hypothetical protein [Arthrobacter koreensis]